MEKSVLEDIELLTSEGSFDMKEVKTISRDEDFFEQMKQIMGEKSWCFIDQKVIEHLKEKAGCFTIDCVHHRMNFSFGGKDIAIEYLPWNSWHRILRIKTYEMDIYVCKDPEEVLFITVE